MCRHGHASGLLQFGIAVEHLHAVHLWHLDVDTYQVGVFRPRPLHGLGHSLKCLQPPFVAREPAQQLGGKPQLKSVIIQYHHLVDCFLLAFSFLGRNDDGLPVGRDSHLLPLRFSVSGSGLHGQSDIESGSLALLGRKGDGAIEQLRQFLGDGQSQSHALLALGIGQAGEGLEHLAAFFRAHAPASIGHLYVEIAIPHIAFHAHATLRGIFQSVVEQVVHDLPHAESVAQEQLLGAPLGITGQSQVPFLRHGAHLLHATFQQSGRGERGYLHLHAAALQSVIVQQRPDELQ